MDGQPYSQNLAGLVSAPAVPPEAIDNGDGTFRHVMDPNNRIADRVVAALEAMAAAFAPVADSIRSAAPWWFPALVEPPGRVARMKSGEAVAWRDGRWCRAERHGGRWWWAG